MCSLKQKMFCYYLLCTDIYIYTYIYIYVHMYICTAGVRRISVYRGTHMVTGGTHVCVCRYCATNHSVQRCRHGRGCHTNAYTYIHTYICIYIHTHIYIYIHITPLSVQRYTHGQWWHMWMVCNESAHMYAYVDGVQRITVGRYKCIHIHIYIYIIFIVYIYIYACIYISVCVYICICPL